MTNPDMVFSADPRHGLVARSGWEQEEARMVLRDLGWEWAEELHALVPPDDVPQVEAAVQAVAELHLHGHRTGYAVGPYGTMRLGLAHAEQVFTRFVAQETVGGRPDGTSPSGHQTPSQRWSAYGSSAASLENIPSTEPDGPGI
ncbi:hypothetical protein [Streptomyces sp. NPDC001401]|uniref:hypothetical protein n=1 Tax=Streptomyces sp. NPDC001401 TaxID=3364570 RepID=UPI0036CDC7B1